MPDTPAAPALPLDRPALESAALRALDLARGLGASDARGESHLLRCSDPDTPDRLAAVIATIT